MPNPIKYSTGSETDALKKGNFYIGTGSVGKGPSDVTGYYQGPSPVSGGYVIYMNKDGAPGNLSYHSAANDAQLISFTNSLVNTSFTSATQCLNYYATQTDKVCVNRDYEGIVTNGLVLNLDAGFTPSYPRSGTTWTDLSLSGNNGTLINGPTFNSDNGGSIVFDGVDDWVTMNAGNNFAYGTGDFTIECWFNDTSLISVPFSVLYSQTVSGANYFLLGVGNGGVNWTGTLSGGGSAIFASGSYLRNTWNYVAASRINGVVTVYLNANGGTPTSNTVNFTNTTYVPTIGDESHHGTNNSWKGNISILRIYKGNGLSATEVLQNYNAQKGRFGL